ncbi:MAG: glycosyltransferase family 4 protein [Acidobacteria bacterium]|nr:glycosyltransferase family 4 protein [Acidobacteriota bacterium]
MPESSNRCTVTLSIGSQAFQMRVAERLQREGMLKRVIAFPRGVEIFDPDDEGGQRQVRSYRRYSWADRVAWAAWRRLPGSKRAWNLPVVFSTGYADRLAAGWIEPCTIFHGWTGNCLACIERARGFGAQIVIEQATMHPREWQRTVLGECERFGVRPRDCRALLPEALVRRMEREYEKADIIVVPSAIAKQSFERAGLGRKAIVLHAGVDHEFFRPADAAKPRSPFRVCFVGRVEIAKGLPYLLEAWKKLSLPNAELVLIGEVAEEMQPFLSRWAMPNLRLTGLLPADEVAELYRSSYLFVFPSVNEGLARSIFEAMASGLPVVATELSGAEDCISSGTEGNVIPARDVDALAEGIRWHFDNAEASRAMGAAARARIESEFTLEKYVDRAIAMYRSMAAGSTQHG